MAPGVPPRPAQRQHTPHPEASRGAGTGHPEATEPAADTRPGAEPHKPANGSEPLCRPRGQTRHNPPPSDTERVAAATTAAGRCARRGARVAGCACRVPVTGAVTGPSRVRHGSVTGAVTGTNKPLACGVTGVTGQQPKSTPLGDSPRVCAPAPPSPAESTGPPLPNNGDKQWPTQQYNNGTQ